VAGANRGGSAWAREGRAKKDRVGEAIAGQGGTGGEGPGQGKFDRCIMHQVHTSYNRKQESKIKPNKTK
jgi:hypothetical protein